MTVVPLRATPIAESVPLGRSRSVIRDIGEIVREVSGSRDLLQQLVKRDIRVRYKQAVFGFAWAVVVPLAVVMAGLTVRAAMAATSGRALNVAQIAGVAVKSLPWAFFVGCLNTATPSIVSNVNLVTKIYFPREVLPLGAVLAQTFDSSIGAGLVLLLLPFLGVHPTFALLWVPVLILMLWVFCLAAALLLSCANLFFRDVKYIVQVFLSFGIFMTPVLLDAPMYGRTGSQWIMLNPVAPILEGLRLAIVERHNLLLPLAAPQGFPFWTPGYLVYSAVWAFGGLLVTAIIFHRAEEHFAELA